MNDYTNFFIYNCLAYILICIIDKIIYKFGIKGRWFSLHAIINFIIIYYSFSDVLNCIYDPNKSILPIDNKYGGSFALSLIYHFSILNYQIDYIHL